MSESRRGHTTFPKTRRKISESIRGKNLGRNSKNSPGIHLRQGYVFIRAPEHQHANGDGYVKEHHLIAEKILGRKLRWLGSGNSNSEEVHHVNQDREDNRNQNLVICSRAYHRYLHKEMKRRKSWD